MKKAISKADTSSQPALVEGLGTASAMAKLSEQLGAVSEEML